MSSPKISVIIPVYNTKAELLAKSVKTVFEQNFTDYEIIIVDDGSVNSDTLISLEELQKNSPVNMRIVHQENMGTSAARMTGVKMAAGQYITFFDSDDFMHFNLLNILSREMEAATDCDLVVVGEKQIDDEDDLVLNELMESDIQSYDVYKYVGGEKIAAGIMKLNEYPNIVSLHGVLLKKNSVIEYCKEHRDVTHGEDRLLLVEYCAGKNDCVMRAVNAVLYYYNCGVQTSTTHQQNLNSITIAKSMDYIYTACLKYGLESIITQIGIMTAECCIGAFSTAARFEANYNQNVAEYATIAKKYEYLLSKLCLTNSIKLWFIVKTPRLYYKLLCCREK